ncbi:MAG: sugar ABC transporter substrate-binding protein [Spirochaetales bacterium]
MKGNLFKMLMTALVVLSLSGVAGAQTISYFNFSGSGDTAVTLNAMKAAFEKANPTIKVNIESVAYADYFTQLQTRAAAGTLPDAFELNYDNFVSYAKRNLLLELGPLFADTKFDTKVLAPKAAAAFTYNGKTYGLPESFSTVLLFYNKDLFDKAKVAYPTESWTWKDMDAAAVKIRALDKNTYGLFQPIQFWEFYKVVRQNGGSLMSADGKRFTVSSAANIATLQVMVDRYNKTNVIPTTAQMGGMGDWDLFKSGRLGMIVTGIWAFGDFIRDNTFDWDVQVEPGNTAKATHFFANGLVINKATKNAKAALAWAQFMASSKEAANLRLDAAWELPAISSTEIVAKYNSATPPANRAAVFKSLDYLVTPPVVDQSQEMTDILGNELSAAKDGKKTPQQALQDAQKALDAKIKL